MVRVAHVEDDVPHELIEVASVINYNAYSNSEIDDKLALLRSVVREKLQSKLRPRKKNEYTKSYRQVPAHVPDKMLAVFNDFVYPDMSKVQLLFYKNALMIWVRANLKIR